MATTSPTPTASQAPTHCPTCGAKVPRPGMTLCAYCAAPLDMSGSAAYQGERSANMERLAKMSAHADYAEAMALEPPSGPELLRARSRIARGAVCAAIGLGALLLPPLVWPGDGGALSRWVLRPGFFLGAVLLVLGLRWLAQGLPLQARLAKLPILKRPAIVTDRRSETDMGFFRGRTDYFFQLEFEDGNAAEFRWPGRGTNEDPLVQGRTGIAYTRGTELLAFKIIKV